MVDLQLETPLTESREHVVVLFEVMGFDIYNNCHRCRSAVKGVQFDFLGTLTNEATVFVAVDASITVTSGQIQMSLGKCGRVYPRPTLVFQNALKLIETCASIGCLGSGLSQIGFEIVLKHDINHILLHLAEKVNPGPTLQGDVCTNECIHGICQQVPFSCSVAAGVSCQPHSKLGDRRGSADPRSATLPMTLRMCFLTRQILIILECVEEVSKSDWAQQVLKTFCTLTGYRMSQGVLNLNHVWVSKRSRWWCILSHPAIGRIHWETFPIFNPPPIVADVLDDFRTCTRDELKQLELDSYEMGKFGPVGIANNLIQWTSQSKTCLHSCGNQLTGCPCGCRQFPFQDERLQSGGIHGHLVQLKSSIETSEGIMGACRHVHPVELALLNGVSPAKNFGQDLKLALCSIGQLASPIQSAWLGSFIIKHFQERNWLTTEVISPKVTLFKMLEGLLKDRDMIFGSPSKPNTKNFEKILRAHLLGEPISQIEILKPPSSVNKGKGGNIPKQKEHANRVEEKTEEEWTCDYKECPVCDPNMTLMQKNRAPDVAIEQHHEAVVSPTVPFEIDLATHPTVDDQALIVATKDAELQVADHKIQEFQRTGGIIGFNNRNHRKRKHLESSPTSKGVHEENCEEENDSYPANIESSVEQEKGSKQQQQNIMIQIHDSRSRTVSGIQVSKGSTVSDLIHAENELSPDDGPMTAWTNIDTPLPLESQISAEQFVSLQHYASFRQHKCPQRGGEGLSSIHFPIKRIDALYQQGPWVAVDEMEYYLLSMHFIERAHPVKPLEIEIHDGEGERNNEDQINIMAEWIIQNMPEADGRAKASAILAERHWNPIVFELQQGILRAIVTPDCPLIKVAIEKVCTEKHLEVDIHIKFLPQAFAADCGFQSLAWIVAVVGGSVNHNQLEHLTVQQAIQWRQMFRNFLEGTSEGNAVIHYLKVGGGKHDDIAKQVEQLLSSHGVFQERLEERFQMICSRIPVTTLKSILSAPRAWQDLKQTANGLKPPIRLIHLQQQIEKRAEGVKQVGSKKSKQTGGKHKDQRDVPEIHVCDVEVPLGVFKQNDGQMLHQITPEQIGPHAQGIILLDQSIADSTLRLPRPVTSKGLGAIVIATKNNTDQHSIAPIRFPAMCRHTQEPIILAGYMYQLGEQEVSRQEPSQKIAVEHHEAETIRCLVYKDQYPHDWDQLKKQPVKTIFDLEPLLMEKTKEGSAKIIDVWDRQWYSTRFERTRPDGADIFAFSMRLLSGVRANILKRSGDNGIYYEPRSQCGRTPAVEFHVTWLQQTSYQDAKYASQMAPIATSLVRHGMRYGLRCDSMEAQQIHSKFRPDTPLLLGSSKQQYNIGPLPYATAREAVQKLLRAWDWDARPLQPKGRSQDGSGVTWLIQAVEDPACWIYTLQHGDVLITRTRENRPVVQDHSLNVVASKKTLEQLVKRLTLILCKVLTHGKNTNQCPVLHPPQL